MEAINISGHSTRVVFKLNCDFVVDEGSKKGEGEYGGGGGDRRQERWGLMGGWSSEVGCGGVWWGWQNWVVLAVGFYSKLLMADRVESFIHVLVYMDK